MDKLNFIIFILIGIVLFIFGAGAGIMYQAQKSFSQPGILDILNSKVVSSVTVYGEVADINGRDITLSYEGERLVIGVASDAQIFSSDSSRQNSDFSQIKKGDYVNAGIKFSSDGRVQAQTIVIVDFGSNQ